VIEGVRIRPLKQITDDRGAVFHMLRSDDADFEQFGEIYFSLVFPGVVKGWHIHDRMSLNYAVPSGTIQLALYDDRASSPTRGEVMEIVSGEMNYQLISVPPGVWNGFKGIGPSTAIVANCATHPHDPYEIHRMDPFDNEIPYDWNLNPR